MRLEKILKQLITIPCPMPAIVDKETCTACGACVEVCPVEAITMPEKAVIDAETCTECGVCVDECPVDAISL
jgi:ferredoxin